MQKGDRTTVGNQSKAYPNGMEGAARIGDGSSVTERAIYLPINPESGANLRYTGDEKPDTDEDRRGKTHRQKRKDDRKSHGGKSKPEKLHSDLSDANGSSSDDDRSDEPDQKKGGGHRSKTKPPTSIPTRQE